MGKNRQTVPENSLEDLIARIQEEGVQEAESRAAAIVAAAHEEARTITEAARQEAGDLLARAQQEQTRRQAMFSAQLAQAGRDAVLTVKGEIVALFERLLRQECQRVLSGQTLESLILKAIDSWLGGRDGDGGLELCLGEADREQLLAGLLAEFQATTHTGVELTAHPGIAAGFRIRERGTHLWDDVTDQAVAEALARHLGPDLAELLGARPPDR